MTTADRLLERLALLDNTCSGVTGWPLVEISAAVFGLTLLLVAGIGALLFLAARLIKRGH